MLPPAGQVSVGCSVASRLTLVLELRIQEEGVSPRTILRCAEGRWGAARPELCPSITLLPHHAGRSADPQPCPHCDAVGTRGTQQGRWPAELAGARKAELGIDSPSIPCNHILQRLLSYISIPHLRL